MDWVHKLVVTLLETFGFFVLSFLFFDVNLKRKLNGVIIAIVASFFFTATFLLDHISMILIDYVIGIIALKMVYKSSFKRTIIATFMTSAIGLSIETVMTLVFSILKGTMFERSDSLAYLIFNTTFVIICYSFYKAKHDCVYRLYLKYEEEVAGRYSLIATLGIYSVSMQIYWEQNYNLFSTHALLFMIMIALVIVINIRFIAYGCKLREKERMLEIHSMYNPIILNLIEEVRQRQHEYKNQINTVYGLVQVTQENQLKEAVSNYLGVMDESLNRIEDFIYTDHLIVSAVLYSKICEAKEKGLNFMCSIHSKSLKLALKDYEISTILANLIDNAFEETAHFDEKDILLSIDQVGQKTVFEVTNPCRPMDSESIRKIFKSGFSTKCAAGRGYGLHNVKQIVKAYGGDIELFFENEKIVFRISFE